MGCCEGCHSVKNKPYTHVKARTPPAYNKNQDRIIACTVSHIDNDKEQYKQTFASNTRIKDVKHTLKKNFSPDMNKRINLYYKGKELTKDSDNLGEICPNEDIDLVMISLSVKEQEGDAGVDNQSLYDKKLQEAVVNKMSSTCSVHPNMRQKNICLDCQISFCEKCTPQHKDHQIINKDTIVDFSNELKKKSEKMSNAFKESGISTYSSENNGVCLNLKNDINKLINQLNEITNGIKRKYEMIYGEFNIEFDTLFPFLLEFNETVDLLYQKSKNEATLRYDQDFIEFYKKCIWVKNQEEKITNYFISLKKMIAVLKEKLADFKNQTEEIVNFVNGKLYALKNNNNSVDYFTTNINAIQGSQMKNSINDNNFNVKPPSDNMEPSECAHKSAYSNQAGLSSGRFNLMTLLSTPKDKRALIRSIEKKNKKDKQSSLQNSMRDLSQVNLIPVGFKDNNEKTIQYRKNHNTFYSLDSGSCNILSFNTISKELTSTKVDLSQCPIKKFEAYHTSINYQEVFYVSGGYSTSNFFGCYDSSINKIVDLPMMLSGHGYHGLVGVGKYMYVISGVKTQKVERFDIGDMKWEAITEVGYCRTYPSCVNIDDKFIYVFGGLCDALKDPTKTVEKYDVGKNAWEVIEINYGEEIPIYYGVIKLSNDELMIIGGKYEVKDEDGIACLKLSLGSKEIKKEDSIRLNKADMFNGKVFANLIDNNYGGFSSIQNDIFYIFNADSKQFDAFTLQTQATQAPE